MGVAKELAAHLKRQKKMFWQRTQKGQSSNQIVTMFIANYSTVKPADRGKNAWTFWQKAYPTLFTVKQARLPDKRTVVVFYPIDEEPEDVD